MSSINSECLSISGSSTDGSIDLLEPQTPKHSKVAQQSVEKESFHQVKVCTGNEFFSKPEPEPEPSSYKSISREVHSNKVKRQEKEFKLNKAESTTYDNTIRKKQKYGNEKAEHESKQVETIGKRKHIVKANDIPEPIIPLNLVTSLNSELVSNSKAKWIAVQKYVMVRQDTDVVPCSPPRTKAAAFDLDNTLFLWRCSQFPSQLHHYELWSSTVIERLQNLHDEESYQLVIFSNQGGIRSAFDGKIATRIKTLINWLATQINRPLFAVVSTFTKSGFHKPNPRIWDICEDKCNRGIHFDLEKSFYVGDSDGGEDPSIDDYRSKAIDKLFAQNVGDRRKLTLQFLTPQEFFGPSDREKRKQQDNVLGTNPFEMNKGPPIKALKARAALLGGYLTGPIMLILCGVQGSGKTTFATKLMEKSNKLSNKRNWVHLSQDTIGKKGKPGKREAVEKEAYNVLSNHQSVIIDRMHLSVDQRSYFIRIATKLCVPLHVIMLNPPQSLIEKRVHGRLNHPSGVQGDLGVKLSIQSLNRLVSPTYQEDADLISFATSEAQVDRLNFFYQFCHSSSLNETVASPPIQLSFPLPIQNSRGLIHSNLLPSIALGTQNIGKRKTAEIVATSVENGVRAIDTAPTYNNEEQIGSGLSQAGKTCFIIVKIPKRAILKEHVRDEVQRSIQKLGQKKVSLILLHWPCDLFEQGTLKSVWEELEALVSEGLCNFLGVCNFTVNALRVLLPMCKLFKPVINQVERHPLLPQWELLDFCTNHGILLQAHTVLGHGSPKLLNHASIVRISRETSNSPAQILLKWNLQQGVPVVTKFTTDQHLEEIRSLLTTQSTRLTPLHMKILNEIGFDSSSQVRIVAPPFMFKNATLYSW